MPLAARSVPIRSSRFPTGFHSATTIALLLAASSALAAVPRAMHRGYAVKGEPTAVVAGDFNGDGRMDLATANPYVNNISVLLNDGAGGFQPHIDMWAQGRPVALAAGDVNRDGILDLAIVDGLRKSILLRHGTGTGEFVDGVELRVGLVPNTVTLADLDLDANLDVVSASSQGAVFVAYGAGNGSFSPAWDYDASETRAVATGDFDHNGRLDVVTSGGCGVSVMLTTSSGGLRAPRYTPVSCGTSSVAVADFDRDGLLDVAANNPQQGRVEILRGGGDDLLTHDVELGIDVPNLIAAADLNHDAIPDLVVSTHARPIVATFIGDGHGAFLPPIWLIVADPVASLAIADFDGDGSVDLATIGSASDFVMVHSGHGDGTFGDRSRFEPGAPVGRNLASADLDRDGHADMVAFMSSGELATWLGDGDGGFRLKSTQPLPVVALDLRLADVTGDFVPDVLVLHDNGFLVFAGVGNGALGAAAVTPLRATATTGGGTTPTGFAVGDVDGDALADVAVTVGPGVMFFRGTGGGLFETPTFIYLSTSAGESQPTAIEAVGLAAGPGRQLIVTDQDQSPFRITWTSPGWSITSAHPRPVDPWVAWGDFDSDGVVDLAFTENRRMLHVDFGSDGVSLTTRVPWVESLARAGCLAGLEDRVVVAGTRGLWSYRPDRRFFLPSTYPHIEPLESIGIDADPKDLAIADFDEDGCWDAAFTTYDRGIGLHRSGRTLAPLLEAFRAEPVIGGMELSWRWTEPTRWTGLQIERALAGDPEWQTVAADIQEQGARVIVLDRDAPPGSSFWYRVVGLDTDGSPVGAGLARAAGAGITAPALGSIYPNPSSGPIRISFTLSRRAPVRLVVSDLAGRVVAVPADGTYAVGEHLIEWDGRSDGRMAPAGVYFVRLQADDQSWTRRVAFVR